MNKPGRGSSPSSPLTGDSFLSHDKVACNKLCTCLIYQLNKINVTLNSKNAINQFLFVLFVLVLSLIPGSVDVKVTLYLAVNSVNVTLRQSLDRQVQLK